MLGKIEYSYVYQVSSSPDEFQQNQQKTNIAGNKEKIYY